MIYTVLTKKAMRIAFDAHKHQVDKTDVPYIFHPIHLAEQMDSEIAACAALLHDVVEDTDITFDELAGMGIPTTVIDVLRLLTHDDSVAYFDYVQNILDSHNTAAIAVKLADLEHNADLSRYDEIIDSKIFARAEKYKAAIRLLTEEAK